MTGRRLAVWLLVLATLAVYLAMALWSLPHLIDLAGGERPFDLRPLGYDPAEASRLLAALGPEGRHFYLAVQQRLDLVYPGLMAAVLIVLFRRQLRGPLAVAAGGVAVLAAGFDYLENHFVRTLILAGPDYLPETTVAAASAATVAKSLCGAVAFTAALAVGLRWGWRRWRRGRR